MDFKTDEQKIIEWAEGLEHSDPDWWRVALPNTIRRNQCSELEARRRLINQAIGSCEIGEVPTHSALLRAGLPGLSLPLVLSGLTRHTCTMNYLSGNHHLTCISHRRNFPVSHG